MSNLDANEQLNQLSERILVEAGQVGILPTTQMSIGVVFDLWLKMKDLESSMKMESLVRERDFYKNQCDKFARESDNFREKYNNSYRENQAKEERLSIQARESAKNLRNDCIKELVGLAGTWVRGKL